MNKYIKEHLIFLEEEYRKRDVEGQFTNYDEILKTFNENFSNIQIPSKNALFSLLYKRLHLKRKTNAPNYATKENIRRVNCMPVGTEIKKEGEIYVKVSDLKTHKKEGRRFRNFEKKQRYLWKQYHKNEILNTKDRVVFLNGDKNDYSKENLLKLSGGEFLRLCEMNALGKGEITLTALEVIRCKNKLKELNN